MRNLILQHFDGNLGELEKLSIENIKLYAELIKSDYKLILGKPFRKNLSPQCQKVHMIHEDFDEYDNVLMVDIDMFTPKDMVDDVFQEKGIGYYSDTQKSLHATVSKRFPKIASLKYPYWGGAIYKLDRASRVHLRKGLEGDDSWLSTYNKSFVDEGIMHSLAVRTNFNPQYPYIDDRWCHASFFPNPEKAGFIHIRTKISPVGPKKDKIQNYYDLREKGII